MLQLTSILFTLFTTLYVSGSTQVANPTDAIATTTPTVIEQSITLPAASSTKEVGATEKKVRSYFSDTPILIEVARCESQFTQFGPNGKPIHGIVNKSDVGVMQINEYYHSESAERMGYDIQTLEGNMAFARHLYEAYGTDPWSASSKCWKNTKSYTELVAKK